MRASASLLVAALALSGTALANDEARLPGDAAAVQAAADPALEARVMVISAELRCLVCQNQTIADSHADLAIDLRQQVREQFRSQE